MSTHEVSMFNCLLRKGFLLALASALSIAIAACGNHVITVSPIVGRWKTSLPGFPEARITREFRSDGTETMVGSADSTHAVIAYTLSGSTLTETVMSMAFGNQQAVMTPAPAGAGGRVSTVSIVGDKLSITYTDGASQLVQTYERVP